MATTMVTKLLDAMVVTQLDTKSCGKYTHPLINILIHNPGGTRNFNLLTKSQQLCFRSLAPDNTYLFKTSPIRTMEFIGSLARTKTAFLR